jgi:transposase
MMTGSELNTLLKIPDVEIEKTEITSNNTLSIYLRSTKQGTKCRCCGKHIEKSYGFDREQSIRHTGVFGNKCYLIIKKPRYECPYCESKPVMTQELSWSNRKSSYTIEYEKHIMLSLVNSTIEDVSAKERIGYGAIEGMLERYIKLDINWEEIKELNVIGIDEIALRKGHQDFATLISVHDDNHGVQILGILEGRKKETVKKFSQYSQEVA